MSIKPRSAKSKGSKFERDFAAEFGGKRVPGSGSLPGLVGDVKLPPPFDSFLWELKSRATIPRIIYEALEQATAARAHHGNLLFPAAAIKGNRGRMVVAFYAEDFRVWAQALSEVGQSYKIKSSLRNIEREVQSIKESL